MNSCPQQQTSLVRWTLGFMLSAAFVAVMPGMSLAEHSPANGARPPVAETLSFYQPNATVSGHMTIAGSDTMQPLLAKLAMEFRRRHPDIKIAVQGSRNHQETSVLPLTQAFIDGLANSRRGDGKVSGHLGSNDVQMLASSRALTAEEIKKFRARHGYEPTAIMIAQDAVALYVHKDNPVPGLTLEQVDAIYSQTRKRGAPDLRIWGGVGLTDIWEGAPIHVYGRDARSTGTLPFFRQVVMLDGDFKKDVQTQPGSASVVLAVAADKIGVGYSGIGFQTSSVRVVPLAEGPGMPFIEPSAETVMSGLYPLSRPLYLYVNKDPNKAWEQNVLEFLRFVNSREAQQTVVQSGVYPLISNQVAKNYDSLAQPAQMPQSHSSAVLQH